MRLYPSGKHVTALSREAGTGQATYVLRSPIFPSWLWIRCSTWSRFAILCLLRAAVNLKLVLTTATTGPTSLAFRLVVPPVNPPSATVSRGLSSFRHQ